VRGCDVRGYGSKEIVELLGERETIEQNIEDKLRAAIAPYGIMLDDVELSEYDQCVADGQAVEV
jgi:regulator of protease activity HflC (stomatin/prohibitin superfamily)